MPLEANASDKLREGRVSTQRSKNTATKVDSKKRAWSSLLFFYLLAFFPSLLLSV